MMNTTERSSMEEMVKQEVPDATFSESILFAKDKIVIDGKEFWPVLMFKSDVNIDELPEGKGEADLPEGLVALLFTESQIRRAKDAAEKLTTEQKDRIVFLSGVVDAPSEEDLTPPSDSDIEDSALNTLSPLALLKLFFMALFK